MTTPTTTRDKQPTATKGFVFLIVIALVGAGLTAFALSLRSEEGPKVAVAEPTPLTVSVMSASMQSGFELQEKYTGIATASRESELGFTTGGRIDSFAADVGDRVSKGQVLATLDTRGLRAQLRASEASIEEARASEDIAETTQDRQEELLEKGHVSSQAVDEAKAQTLAAAARVLSAAARADTLRVEIDLATITAPFDGVVTDRFADEGVIASPGQRVLRLVETGPMEARIGVPVHAASRLETGGRYTLIADGRNVSATLRSVTGIIDSRSRTVTTIFDIDEGAGIPAGTVLRLALDETISEDGIWVPVAALTEVARGVWSVLVAERDGSAWIAKLRPVTVIHSDGDRTFVRGVIGDGDLIILDGLQRVTPNQPVTPRQTSFAGRPAAASD